MLKIPPKMLIVAAAVVWLAAGLSVTGVGVTSASHPWDFAMALMALIVYVLFLIMFLMISRKHIRRIRGYTEELINMFKFFDPQSYILLAVMVGLGVAVRISGLVPGSIIAPVYGGLGMALITAAAYYLVTYIAICDELITKSPRQGDSD
jgi:hypothetical protein